MAARAKKRGGEWGPSGLITPQQVTEREKQRSDMTRYDSMIQIFCLKHDLYIFLKRITSACTTRRLKNKIFMQSPRKALVKPQVFFTLILLILHEMAVTETRWNRSTTVILVEDLCRFVWPVVSSSL